MERDILELLTRHRGWVLFVAQTLGLFGLPVPDEIILSLAGGLVRHGDLHAATTIAAAGGGGMAGVTLSYAFGRLGARVLEHLPAAQTDTLRRAQQWLKQSGRWLLVFGWFIPGVRHVTAIAAGSAPVKFATFCAYAYPGALIWSLTFLATGYYAADERYWNQAMAALRAHIVLMPALVGAVAVVYLISTVRKTHANSAS